MADKQVGLRRCFLEPVPEIATAVALLDRAADAHLAGDAAKSEALIRQADMPRIAAWTTALWGRLNPEIHAFRDVPDAPPVVLKAERARPRMPGVAVKAEIEARDGMHCRFCGIPVIRREVRALLASRYPRAARWGASEENQHAALQCLWLQYDHLLPHSRGGDSSADNVVITCAPCNFARGDRTLAEAGLADPRERPPPPTDGWDGLDRLLLASPRPRAAVVESEAAAGDFEPRFAEPVADALDIFEDALAERGVWVETTAKRARMLRWRAPDGTVFTLASLREDATVSTYDVGWPAEKRGCLPLAHAYLELLAAVLDGSVRRTERGFAWHVRGPDGGQPPLAHALARGEGWTAAIDAYLAALAAFCADRNRSGDVETPLPPP